MSLSPVATALAHQAMVPIYIENSTAELASPLRRHEGGPNLPEDGSPVQKRIHMIAGVRRGHGVKPLAPAIGELHVRQIFFLIGFHRRPASEGSIKLFSLEVGVIV